MHPYLTALTDSELSLEPWLLGVTWLVLFVGTHVVGRYSRLQLRAQEHVVVEESIVLAHPNYRRFVFVQVAFAVLLFSLSYMAGEPVFTLIGGGLVAARAMTFGLNLHSLAFARRLQITGIVAGTVTLSPVFVLGDIGYRALGAAVVFLVTGLVFAQLALLGGALILAFSGLGYIQRSRRPRAQP